MKTHTDLKGIFSVDVIVHGQHGDVEAGQQNAAKYPLLFLICTGKQNKSTCCNFPHALLTIMLKGKLRELQDV